MNPHVTLARDQLSQRMAALKQPGKVGSPTWSPGLTGSAGLARSTLCLTPMPSLSWDRASCLFAQLGVASAPHFAPLLPGIAKTSAEEPGLDFVSINRSHQRVLESDKHLQCL